MAQDEDVLGRETKARKLFVVELSEPRPYALLPGIVSSLNKPAHQVRSGFQRSRRARGHALARMMVIDSLLISLQRKPTSARGLAHQPDASSRLDPC